MSKIKLGGVTRPLYFDLNTYTAFEEKTGQFFLESIARLQQAVSAAEETIGTLSKDPAQQQKQLIEKNMAVLRRVSFKDIHALLWAALHEYDPRNPEAEPTWPLSHAEVGRMVNFHNLSEVINIVMNGITEHYPNQDEMPQEVPTDGDRPTESPSPAASGGETSSGLPDSISASLELSSDA